MIPNKETVLKENCPDLPPAFPVPFLWVDNFNDGDDDAMQMNIKIMIIKKNVFAYQTHFWISAYGLPSPVQEHMDNWVGYQKHLAQGFLNQSHGKPNMIRRNSCQNHHFNNLPAPRIRSQDILRPQNRCPSQGIEKLNLCRIQQCNSCKHTSPTNQLSEESYIKSTQISN